LIALRAGGIYELVEDGIGIRKRRHLRRGRVRSVQPDRRRVQRLCGAGDRMLVWTAGEDGARRGVRSQGAQQIASFSVATCLPTLARNVEA
jgi:uncharacterized membrane protein YdbT with pleckstrin-like domain